MNKFDPETGLPIKQVVAPLNTRTAMYHPARPSIVVEGKGNTDVERRASLEHEINAKKKQGYRLERFHGQHPHSNDEHRLDFQRRSAEAGDKEAAAALKAKGKGTPETAA